MANTKISALASGNPALTSDILPIDRAGANFSLTAGSIASLGISGSTFTSLPSAKIGGTFAITTGTGDNDIFTVPAGKRATVQLTIVNNTGGNLNEIPKVKSGGVYYQSGALVSRVNLTTSQYIAFNTFPILEENEIFSLNYSGPGVVVFGYAITFDNTEALKSPKILALTSGDQTIYTCPTGKKALVTNMSGAGNGPMRVYNGTAGLRTYTWNDVPSGGSVSAANRLYSPFTVNTITLGSSQTTACPGLSAGDFLSINSDSALAGQFAYILNLVEVPA
jgi:hypothetical protein